MIERDKAEIEEIIHWHMSAMRKVNLPPDQHVLNKEVSQLLFSEDIK